MTNSKIGPMTIIDETATISSMQRIKQVFSPKPTFPPKPYVKVPPPFSLDIEEFMPKKMGGNKTSNAFIIYRTVFAKVLIGKDFQSKMTDVSKWASTSWKNESDDVKNAYKKFAKDIQAIHKRRSQDALISRGRRLISADTPRLEGSSAVVPSQMNLQEHEVPTYHQENLMFEQELFPTYHFSFQYPEKEFQTNYPIADINEFDQSSLFSGEAPFETLSRDLDVADLAISSLLMHPMLQQTSSQEVYPEVQPYNDEGNNEPGWVLDFNKYYY